MAISALTKQALSKNRKRNGKDSNRPSGQADSYSLSSEILDLQNVAGNRAVSQSLLLGSQWSSIRESSHLANMAAQHQQASIKGVCPICGKQGQGHCIDCGQPFVLVQRHETLNEHPTQTALSQKTHTPLLSQGRPLERTIRIFMESRFGRDFSQVRVHTNAQAGESAKTVYASAYTVGNHIVFAPGRFFPSTEAGKRLLTHELAHVVQQTGGLGRNTTADLAEIEAEGAAEQALTGGHVRIQTAVSRKLMRELDPDAIKRQLAELERQAAKQVTLSNEELAAMQAKRNDLMNQLSQAMRARARSRSRSSRTSASAGENKLLTSSSASELSAVQTTTFAKSLSPQTVAPAEMVNLVVEQRGFGAGMVGPTESLGPGYQTNAALQVVDGNGKQVAFELAQYGGGGGPHAEAQAVARLRLRLGWMHIPGGRLIVAVDQVACGGCLARIRSLARELGLESYEIWAPTRAKASDSGDVTHKTAARTATSITKQQANAQRSISDPGTLVDVDTTLRGISESILEETASPGTARATYRMQVEMIQGESLPPNATALASQRTLAARGVERPKATTSAHAEEPVTSTAMDQPSSAKAEAPSTPEAQRAAPRQASKEMSPGVERTPGAPEPKAPEPRVGGRKWGGTVSGIFGIAIPFVQSWIHSKAVETRIEEQAKKKGYVPPGAPSGQGFLYDLGAWLIDPLNDADYAVGIDKRFNLPVWRAHIRELANAKKPGEILEITWNIGHCNFDFLGRQEIENRRVVYRKQDTRRWIVDSGNPSGTPDLNDIISTQIPDSTLQAIMMRDPCLV